MTTADDVLAEARRWIGTTEQGPNQVPGVTDRFGIEAAWCDMWVSTVLEAAGIDLPGVGFTWVSSHFDWAKKQPGWTVFSDWKQAQPGDLVGWEWGRTPGGLDHISIVEANGPFVTIGGNERDAVRRQTFGGVPNGAVIFARPPYTPAPTPAEPAPAPPPAPAPAPSPTFVTPRESDVYKLTNPDGRKELLALSPDGTFIGNWETAKGSGYQTTWAAYLPASAPKFSGIYGEVAADGRLAATLVGPLGAIYGCWQLSPGAGPWVLLTAAELRALGAKA